MARSKNLEKKTESRRVVARLLAHRGYHHASMWEIARELGMNQSSLITT
jgi:AcrR family transcriptional regulator